MNFFKKLKFANIFRICVQVQLQKAEQYTIDQINKRTISTIIKKKWLFCL